MAAFVDTNILIYAFVQTATVSVHKASIAKALIDDLLKSGELLLSAQVLSEFSANAMLKSKPPLTVADTIAIVNRLGTQMVIPIDASLVELALQRTQHSRISYWDALIVEAAIRSGATTLYTEDMHHGTRYGELQLVNPFVS